MQRIFGFFLLGLIFFSLSGMALEVQPDIACRTPKSYTEIKGASKGNRGSRAVYEDKRVITEWLKASDEVTQWVYDNQGHLLATSLSKQRTPRGDYVIHAYEGLVVFSSFKQQFAVILGKSPETELEDLWNDAD